MEVRGIHGIPWKFRWEVFHGVPWGFPSIVPWKSVENFIDFRDLTCTGVYDGLPAPGALITSRGGL